MCVWGGGVCLCGGGRGARARACACVCVCVCVLLLLLLLLLLLFLFLRPVIFIIVEGTAALVWLLRSVREHAVCGTRSLAIP